MRRFQCIGQKSLVAAAFLFITIALASCDISAILGGDEDDDNPGSGLPNTGTIEGTWLFSIGFYPSGSITIYVDDDPDPSNGSIVSQSAATPAAAPSTGQIEFTDVTPGDYYVYAICHFCGIITDPGSVPGAGNYIGFYSDTDSNGDPGAPNVSVEGGGTTEIVVILEPIYGVSGRITSTTSIAGTWYLILLDASRSTRRAIGNGTFSGTQVDYSVEIEELAAGDYYLEAVIDVNGSATEYDPEEVDPAVDFGEDSVGSLGGTAGTYLTRLTFPDPINPNLSFGGNNNGTVVHENVDFSVGPYDTPVP